MYFQKLEAKALLDLAPTVLGPYYKKIKIKNATNNACGNIIALKVLGYRENYELGLSLCAISWYQGFSRA